jgi:hypothetical protein
MNRLVFRQIMSPGLRRFMALAGLFCFFPTWDLLIRPGVPVLELGMLPMWIIALGAGALGLLLLIASVLGISRRLIFDAAAAELREIGAGAFGLRWQNRYFFRELGAPAVQRETDSEGPTRFAVMIPCARLKQRLRVDSYDSEAEAADIARRIADVMEAAT